jgi:trimeric autotransporter adhesin
MIAKRLLITMVCIAALALMFSPVSAALNHVAQGKDVFIGEQGLDISDAVGNATQIAWFTSGTDNVLTGSPSKVVSVGNKANFYVSNADFGGRTGNWYISGTSTIAFVVNEPSMTVKLWDLTSASDVTGKNVPRGDKIDFRIESNLYAIQQRDTSAAFDFKIKVKTADGAVYTSLNTLNSPNRPLVNLGVNSNLFYWAAMDVNNAWNLNAADSSGNKLYNSGIYRVTAECNQNKLKDNYGEVEGKTVTPVVTLTVATDTLKLTAAKTSVTRGSQFSVVIYGQPNTQYQLYIKNAGTDVCPTFTDYQDGVVVATNKTYATVTTASDGYRTVGFSTTKDTKDKKYTIKAETSDSKKSDEVSVTVAEGKISIESSSDTSDISTNNIFSLGDEITLSGVNTETDNTYFFITGPNLPSSGAILSDPREATTNNDASTFASTDVIEDNTYEFKWYTSDIGVDAGTYTVYAVTAPKNRDHLSDAQYATTSITLKKPGITAKMSQSTVGRGDTIYVRGSASNVPSQGVAIWIFGKNYVSYKTVDVEDDGSFEYEITSDTTQNFANGQYYVVAQHPMYNDQFDVYPDNANKPVNVLGIYPIAGNTLFMVAGNNRLQGSDAAQALISEINKPVIDDRYTSLSFVVAEPIININGIGSVNVGTNLTISGTTNLAVGDEIIVEIVSSSFKPTDKSESGGFSGSTGTVTVKKGTSGASMNTWSFNTSTNNWKVDNYIVSASGIVVPATSSATFDVIGTGETATHVEPTTVAPTTKPTVVNATSNATPATPVPTPVPTPIPTAPPTPVPTPVATPVPTPIPTTHVPTPLPTATSAPGFSSVIAVVGLLAVAFLVVRKN